MGEKVFNWKKPYCPCLKGSEVKLDGETVSESYDQCTVPIVKGMFDQYCNTANFVNCIHFAKNYGLLKQPIEWLLKEAVEKESATDLSIGDETFD